jgi:hypothetical protein
MTDRELMQQALMALEEGLTSNQWRELITALRERLAQPEQEPEPAMFGPMGTVGDLFDKHVIANGNLKKEWIVYLERNT